MMKATLPPLLLIALLAGVATAGVATAAGSAAAAPGRSEAAIAKEFDLVASSCRSLALEHLGVVERAIAPSQISIGGNKSPNPEANVVEKELAFLLANESRIRGAGGRLASLEADILALPPERMQQISLGSLQRLCKLAAEVHGYARYEDFGEDVALQMKSLRNLEPARAPLPGAQQPLPAGPRTPENIALEGRRVADWHKTVYLAKVNPFKVALSQLMVTPIDRPFARREACRRFHTAGEALLKSQALEAPDPAVAAQATAMATKFLEAAKYCLAGNQEETEIRLRAAEKEVAKLALVLADHGLKP